MKKSMLIGALVVAGLGGWVYAGPYLALKGLKDSVEGKNPQAMYDYIDFPVFKENLKREMLKDAKPDKDNPFAEIGNKIVDGLVDMFVNPETLIKVLAKDSDGPKSGGDKASDMGNFGPKLDLSEDKLKLGYVGLNSFELSIPEEDGGEWTLILHRKGFGWKIDDVRIKADAKSAASVAAASDTPSTEADQASDIEQSADEAQAAANAAVAAADAAMVSADTAGAESSEAPAADDRYCGNMYRNLTPADFSDDAVAKFEAECPGYDLPIQWADVSLRKAMRDEEVKPSFECAKASTQSEQLICSDTELRRLDSSLSAAYALARSRAGDKGALKNAQNQWRTSTRDGCADVSCMRQAYEERIEHLRSL